MAEEPSQATFRGSHWYNAMAVVALGLATVGAVGAGATVGVAVTAVEHPANVKATIAAASNPGRITSPSWFGALGAISEGKDANLLPRSAS